MSPKHMIGVGIAITLGMLYGGEFGYSLVLGIGIGLALAGLVRVIRDRNHVRGTSNG